MICTDQQLRATLDAPSTIASNYRQKWALEALKGTIVKKFLSDVRPTKEQNNAALASFLKANKSCGSFAIWQRDRTDRDIDAHIRLMLFKELGSFSLTDVYSVDAHGPGASRLLPHNDFYTKMFGGPLSTTSGYLWTLRVNALPSSAISAELCRQMNFGRYTKVKGSSLSFVAKQNNTSRVICTEPVLNMTAQISIGRHLEKLLSRLFGINLSRQPDVNRELARRGSIDGSVSTIDLSSASDTISLGLIEYLFPEAFVRALKATRSPYTRLPDGRSVRLQMVSSMGNGFTFPLETLVFACIVHAVYSKLKISAPDGVNVFGDDIICDTSAYDLVVHTLTRYGFTVNQQKSFAVGPFRESCGGDFLYGVDVRGVYVKRLAHDVDWISAFNRLRLWSLRHQICIFRTLLYIRRHIRKPCYGPHDSDVTCAIFCEYGQAVRYGGASVVDVEGKPLIGPTYYRWVKTRTPRRDESAPSFNSRGMTIAASTGRCSSHPVTGAVWLSSKQITMRRRIRQSQSSIWPATRHWLDVGVTAKNTEL